MDDTSHCDQLSSYGGASRDRGGVLEDCVFSLLLVSFAMLRTVHRTTQCGPSSGHIPGKSICRTWGAVLNRAWESSAAGVLVDIALFHGSGARV